MIRAREGQPAGKEGGAGDAAVAGARARLGRILVVEDEGDVAELLRCNLEREGYEVVQARSGGEAVRKTRDTRPDLVLLDLMIPELNGWEVCRRLKQDPATEATPVVILTARAEEGDKVLGFEMGADDYVTKPFAIRELLARVRAVLRRAKPPQASDTPHRVKVGELEIDRRRFEVRMRGRPVPLTSKEFELLATLAGEPGRVFGRDELLDLVWGRDGFVEPRTVDVHLARLRGKFLMARVPAPDVETVRGVGYRYREAGGGT
jgi:DNA-binding response OmpR family regulator